MDERDPDRATDLITKLRSTFRMAALSLVVVIGGSLVGYFAVTAILWIVFTMFGS
jgi:uncharacterized MAPEG superfamily protein